MQDFSSKTDKQLLAIVRRGQEAFFQTAFAIYEIDRRKLWKTAAKSLADFCDVEFGMNPADVSRYKGAARVLMNLDGFSQARELVRLRHAEPQKTVWQAVVDRVAETGEAITAKLIRETAESVFDQPEEETQPEPEIVVSGVGRLVQVAQMLSDVTVAEDERNAAREQLDLIQTILDGLKASLAS